MASDVKGRYKKFFLILFRSTIIAVPSAYLLIGVYYYFMQEELLFRRQKITPERIEWINKNYPGAMETRLKTPDGTELHGWFLKTTETKSPLIIFFGGNADEASMFVPDFRKHLEDWSVLLINYRGYGLSGGSPGEKELYGDAVFLYDTFSRENYIDASKIAVVGRSLGTGVAVYLASQRPLERLVLISPYDSIAKVAKDMYPFLPVSFLLKHPFDAVSFAPGIKTPALALATKNDAVVSYIHSESLMRKWGGSHELSFIDAEGHGGIAEAEETWRRISAFLNGI